MRTPLLALLPVLVTAADLRIDHVSVAGQNLAALSSRMTAIGFTVEAGGSHNNHATAMSIVSFADGSYLELIARAPDYDAAALAKSSWGKQIEGNAGPAAWAVRPKDFAAEFARLRSAGLALELNSGGRTRLDGVALRWETADFSDPGLNAILPFFIRDLTKRELRAFPSGKPGNRDYRGVSRVVVAVRDLKTAAARFVTAYGDSGKPLKQIDKRFGAELAWIPDSPIIFAAPLGTSSWLAKRIEAFGEGPCAFILSAKGEPKVEGAAAVRWFGRDLKWFDPEKLGWWLGVEGE